VFSEKAFITIPFSKLFLNLLVTVGPCLIGILLSSIFPKLKQICVKIAKPFTLAILVSFLIMALVSKSYIFTLMRWHHLLGNAIFKWVLFFALSIFYIHKLKTDRILRVRGSVKFKNKVKLRLI
jgi:hypothetical protein